MNNRLINSLWLSLACLAGSPVLAATDERPAAWITYFQSSAQSLSSPEHLDPLLAAVTDRKLVLLGESTHGTHEYYHWRDQISRRLVSEQGFNFIAVEGDWEAIYALNRYVKLLPDAGSDPESILLEFDRWPQWMWANAEVVELAEWLRDFNSQLSASERVGLYGVDVYGWGQSVERLPGYLEQLRSGWGEEVRRQLQPLQQFNGNTQRFLRAAVTGGSETMAVIDTVIAELHERRADMQPQQPKLYLQAHQSAKLIRQAKRHMRAAITPDEDGWNPRAENFIATVTRLFEYYGDDARGILWAHNTHIGDARQTSMVNAGMVNAGQQAREQFGMEDTFLVGFATYAGDVIAARAWEAQHDTMVMPPARTDSFASWMYQAGLQQALILLRPVAEEPVFIQPGLQRAVGVVYNPAVDPGQNYVPTILPRRYDALMYFEQTMPLTPLHSHQ